MEKLRYIREREHVGVKDRFVVLLGQQFKCGETLVLSHVHVLDRVKLLEEGGDGVQDDGDSPGQSLHHIGQCVACVVHQLEVVVHLEDIECGHHLTHGEAGQDVFVAHGQHLTHLDHNLQLPVTYIQTSLLHKYRMSDRLSPCLPPRCPEFVVDRLEKTLGPLLHLNEIDSSGVRSIPFQHYDSLSDFEFSF